MYRYYFWRSLTDLRSKDNHVYFRIILYPLYSYGRVINEESRIFAINIWT